MKRATRLAGDGALRESGSELMAVERELVQDHAAVWVALVKAARVHSVVSAREEVVRPEPARRLSRRQPDERQHKKTRRPTSAFYQLDTSTTTSTTTALPKQSEYFLLSVAHNLTFLEMLFQFVAWVLTTGRDFLDREVIHPLENEVSFFFSRCELPLTFLDASPRDSARHRGGRARGRLRTRRTFGHARPNVPRRVPS